MRKILLLLLTIQLFGCSGGMDGTYTDPMQISKYEFKSNGDVIITSFGSVVEAEYKINGDKLKIGVPQGSLIMTILEDGTIEGPMGLPLKRVKQ